ncbi:Prohead protease [uncultured Caudovirales phage]|uniref:Prohead protease n=1 Tax=uncultured Caudovirales phage TaxID=2100421 RepID=A0A6J5P7A7_9CAUD|nr:Prohead protease [uncultured Caudovirales phage]
MIHFHADLDLIIAEAGDENRPARIAGIAVPWDVVATVSGGQRVKFLRGAFDLTQKPAKLLENHDMSQLRGIVNTLSDSDAGLEFEATLADTRASKDAVALLKAGAYDSVSVGANPVQFKYDKAGVMVVAKAQLIELSLVAVPAFSEAVITEIAASADPEDDENNQPIDTPQEDKVSEEIKAESPESATTPTSPLLYAQARREFKLPSASEYIAAFVRGGHDFAQMNDNIRAAAPDVVTSDIPGVIPTPIVAPIYNNFQGRRPLIDATGVRAMPQAGAIFIRPVVTTHNSIGTATQNTTITASAFQVDDVQITKTIQGGYVEISEASMDWSQPEVLGALLDDMARVYADRTDLLACSELNTGTTNSNNFANASIADPAYWVEWMYTAAADILTGSNGNLPSVLVVSPNVWKLMGSLSDTADRPLFPQVGPMNAFGSLSPGGDSGFAFGLRVVVDRNITSAGMFIMDPTAIENWEQQKGAISVEQPSQLSRQIAFRGYFASKVIDTTKTIKAAFV